MLVYLEVIIEQFFRLLSLVSFVFNKISYFKVNYVFLGVKIEEFIFLNRN